MNNELFMVTLTLVALLGTVMGARGCEKEGHKADIIRTCLSNYTVAECEPLIRDFKCQ